MTRSGSDRPGRIRPGRLAVPLGIPAAAVSVAVASVAVLHLTMDGVDPLRQPLSDYATVPGGYLLVWVAAAAMAAAAIALSAAVGLAGLPRARPVRLLLGTWSAALVLVAAFPTNAPGTAPDLAAAVHRVAAAWVVAALPMIGWLTGLRARTARCWAPAAPSILGWSAAVAGFGVAFLAAHLPLLVGGPPFGVLGVLERCLCLAVAGLMLVLGRAVRLAADHGADARSTGAAAMIEIVEPA